MRIKTLPIILVVLLAPSLQQQQQLPTPQSPCPNVFQYEPPGSTPGRWYGVASLTTDSTLHSLWLNIVLDSKADILGNWIGDVSTLDNIDFKIENTKMKIQPGPVTTVRFFVQYSPLNKPPKIQAIRLNGREICNANTPQPALDRPEPRPSATQKPVRTTRPVVRPDDTGIRPEDVTGTRPVQGRPSAESGPVYQPTQNPPIEQSNANPYSLAGGPSGAGTQSGGRRPVGGDRDTSRPNWSSQTTTTTTTAGYDDFDDDNKPVDESEYFGGGLVTIVSGNTNTKPNYYDQNNNNRPQATCGRVVMNASPNPLVVNGRPTLEGQWPWQIALYQTQTVDNKYICGGTLVSKRHIVTAAHCVTRKASNRIVNKNTLTVYLGKHNLRTSVDGVQIRLVGDIRVHPSYNASSYANDLGVLTLREPAAYSDRVQPACLWPEAQVDLSNVIGKRGSVVGWGFDDKGVATEELTLVEMPVVEQETCIRSYSDFFARFTSEYTYCAGYRDGQVDRNTGTRKSTSVCNGDSGGGMVFKIQNSWYLRGLVSLSVARPNEYRCDPTHYVVFTDIAKFLSWIKQNVDDY